MYDLDQWNAEYFDRLQSFLARASQLGIVVELTLFSNTYGDGVWALNPLRATNNVQKVGAVEWQDYNTLKDRALNERQFAFAEKIVRETSGYDNVYYEICNEPGGGFAGHASPADVDAWQAEVARVVREALKRQQRDHLVSASQAFSYTPKFTQDAGRHVCRLAGRRRQHSSAPQHRPGWPRLHAGQFHVQGIDARRTGRVLSHHAALCQALRVGRRQHGVAVSRPDRLDDSPQAGLDRADEPGPLRFHRLLGHRPATRRARRIRRPRFAPG